MILKVEDYPSEMEEWFIERTKKPILAVRRWGMKINELDWDRWKRLPSRSAVHDVSKFEASERVCRIFI